MVLPSKPQSPSTAKEQETLPSGEKYPVVEVSEIPEVEPGTTAEVQTIPGEEISLPQPVTDDSGVPIVTPPAPQKVAVSLPLTEKETSQSLIVKLANSVSWLAQQCKRLAQIVGGKFTYKFSQKSEG